MVAVLLFCDTRTIYISLDLLMLVFFQVEVSKPASIQASQSSSYDHFSKLALKQFSTRANEHSSMLALKHLSSQAAKL